MREALCSDNNGYDLGTTKLADLEASGLAVIREGNLIFSIEESQCPPEEDHLNHTKIYNLMEYVRQHHKAKDIDPSSELPISTSLVSSNNNFKKPIKPGMRVSSSYVITEVKHCFYGCEISLSDQETGDVLAQSLLKIAFVDQEARPIRPPQAVADWLKNQLQGSKV